MISNVKFNDLEKRLDLLVEKVLNLEPVSYTHLTLPTILLV